MAVVPRVINEPRPRSLWPFLIISAGQAVSWFGSEVAQFALVWWLTATTGSAVVLTVGTLLAVLPRIVIGPFAGALVDRWDRRAVLITADAATALAAAALAVVYAVGAAQIWHVYAVLLIRAIGGVFHLPAMAASTTLLVPERHLARVSGLNQTLAGIIAMVAPALGAGLLAALPMPAILVIDVATAAPAIGALLVIPIPRPPRELSHAPAGRPAPVRAVLAELRDGLRVAWGWRGVRLMIGLFMALNILTQPLLPLVPILITRHFGGGVGELAWFQSILGIGGLLGGLALGLWGGGRRVLTMTMALLLHGLGILALGLTPAAAFALALAAWFVVGVTGAVVNGTSLAILQTVVPPALQGRVLALTWSGVTAAAPLGLALAGPVADTLGAPLWYVIAGAGVAVLSVMARFMPALMGIEARSAEGPA